MEANEIAKHGVYRMRKKESLGQNTEKHQHLIKEEEFEIEK